MEEVLTLEVAREDCVIRIRARMQSPDLLIEANSIVDAAVRAFIGDYAVEAVRDVLPAGDSFNYTSLVRTEHGKWEVRKELSGRRVLAEVRPVV